MLCDVIRGCSIMFIAAPRASLHPGPFSAAASHVALPMGPNGLLSGLLCVYCEYPPPPPSVSMPPHVSPLYNVAPLPAFVPPCLTTHIPYPYTPLSNSSSSSCPHFQFSCHHPQTQLINPALQHVQRVFYASNIVPSAYQPPSPHSSRDSSPSEPAWQQWKPI